MRIRSLASLAALAIALAGCATAQTLPDQLAHADLRDAQGKPAGQATITARNGTVSLTIQATGLRTGPHGMHLHAVGSCDTAGFTGAGGHLNPAGHQHGSMNPAGAHLGDLPNLAIAADGAGAATVMLPGTWADLAPAIFDADGTAIVIHAGEDDYKTDPSGNSGGRIACGVFTHP